MPPQSSASPAGGSSHQTGLDPDQPSGMGCNQDRAYLTPEVDANPDEALLLGDRHFQILFEAALDAMVIADDQGCYVAVNRAACALFGLERERLLGRSIADFTLVGFNLEQAWQDFQSRSQERGEFSLVRADGTIREVEYAATAHIVPHRHLSILRDVTERKQLERQLHQLNQDLEQQVIQRTAELQQTNQALQRVNQQLQTSQQKYETLFNILPVGVCITDAEGMVLEVNSASEQILGLSVTEQAARTCDQFPWQVIYPDGRPVDPQDHATVRALRENRVIVGEEVGIVHPRGHVRWVCLNTAPIPLDGYGVAIAYTDISERKQAQEALTQQSAWERSLRVITQHIRETLDLDDILATAVTEVQRLLQADRTLIFQLCSDRSGVVIQEVVRSDYPSTLNSYWDDECFPPECYAAYAQGQPRIIPDVALDQWGDCLVEFMRQTAVQSKIVAPIVQQGDDDSRRIWGLLIVHACAEPRIWHNHEANLLQQVADQLAIAIQQAELYSQVQTLNINLEQQVRVRTADLQQALEFELLLQRIIDQVRDSLSEDQILETVVRELGQGLNLVCCDTGIYNQDLTTSTIAHEYTQSLTSAKGITFQLQEATHRDIYPFLFQGQILQFCDRVPCALRLPQGQLTVLACPILDDQRVLGDMWLYKQSSFHPSEVRLVQQVANQCAIALRQSRLYQAAQDQVRALERLNQLKDDFLSTVSHELRTPLSSIKMAIQMLESSLQSTSLLTDASQESSRYFHILKTECQREMQLINDLLELTHLDAGTEPLTLIAADLRFLIPHIVEPFVDRTRAQQQHFSLEIPTDLPTCITDLSYLERIITELLHNACKYTPAGEAISLTIQAIADHLEITIRNTGVEIAPGECDRIFERFYRIPNNDPWKHGGTGLGLALVKKLIEQLGGTIRVASGQGQTAFILTLHRCGLGIP